MREIHAAIRSIHDVAPAPAPCIEGVDWRPLRDALGVTAFGLNAYVGAEPGALAVGAAPGKPFEVSEWETRQHALGREA